MKKSLLFLTTILLVQLNVFAQFTRTWRAVADGTTYSWLDAVNNANNVASLAYNPATNKLLVSSRNSNVYILNAATGAQEGTLSLIGLGGESFKFNKIRVDADGVIYGISLATGATNACKIYRWASQTSPPVECASFTTTERCGDSFGLSGTGANTVLYASGAGTASNAFSIYILNTTNGTAFTTESKVTMTSTPTNLQWANRVVEPVGTGVNSDIWINGGGFNARRISISAPASGVRTGTVVTTIADGTTAGQASIGYGGMRYITGTANKFLVFAGGNNSEAGTVMRALNVTNEAAITLHGTDSLYAATSSYVTNGNGSGDVSFKVNSDGSFTTFFLSTNNGIAATLSDINVLPVELISFNASIKNNVNTLSWVTASESNNAGFDIESSTNSTDFSKIGFVTTKANGGNSSEVLNYSFQDYSAASGTIYYRLKQVDKNGAFKYYDVKAIKNPLAGGGANALAVYPNPTTNYVDIAGADAVGITVQLFTTNGSEINTSKLLQGKRLDVSGLNTGIYILRIINNGTLVSTTKFVKN